MFFVSKLTTSRLELRDMEFRYRVKPLLIITSFNVISTVPNSPLYVLDNDALCVPHPKASHLLLYVQEVKANKY